MREHLSILLASLHGLCLSGDNVRSLYHCVCYSVLASEVQACCFLFYFEGFLHLCLILLHSLSLLGLLCFLLDCSSFC